MEALILSSSHFTKITRTKLPRPQEGICKSFHFNKTPVFYHSSIHKNIKPEFSLFTALSPSPSTEQEDETQSSDEKFDWYAQWYPIMPLCELDKRIPHGKKIMVMDIVVWWDRNENSWKVFNDMCPHRLAPLSEGRIDQWGRLQCVYHGWCFDGSGGCKFIPQAPPDGPPVHTSKKACATVYPSVVQNEILWFWPNSDPKYSDILSKKKPHYIPELDDTSFNETMATRDIPYGYDVLIDNLMDPSHVRYAHRGIVPFPKQKDSDKADREGGKPLDISVEKVDINGYSANQGGLKTKFLAPCTFYAFPYPGGDEELNMFYLTEKKRALLGEGSALVPRKRIVLIFFCIPVSPGNSRLIWGIRRNFTPWIDQFIPQWIFHLFQNMPIIDSDLFLLHAEEHKLREIGPSNWQKACFLPTNADAQVVAFRMWLNKYAGGQVDWGTKYTGALPPTPPREQLMDRYWTHVVNCTSCRNAYKGLNAFEVVLQVASVALIGIVAATKQNMLSILQRNAMIVAAVLCFMGSRWMSHFVYKNFHFHDYNHAFH